MADPGRAQRTGRLRFFFGIAQMFGAGLGFMLLILTGVSPATVAVTATTTVITCYSRWLFRMRA